MATLRLHDLACETTNATFQLLEPVQSRMCALPAIRTFSFFSLESGSGRQEACFSVIRSATC